VISRRDFLKFSAVAGASAYVATSRLGSFARAFAATQGPGLSDPALQPKFEAIVPNALDPGFIYDLGKGAKKSAKIGVGQTVQQTGLRDGGVGGLLQNTTIWGYGDKRGYTWPGRTFQVSSGDKLEVKWENRLVDANGNPLPFFITGKDNTAVSDGAGGFINYGDFTGRSVVDTSLHWAYSLKGMSSANGVDYTQYTIKDDGVPIVPHVHGGHTDFWSDGNPEFFFSPNFAVRGPQWVEKTYYYDNSQPAGTVWYHDHALGLTRLNVYAGMAGFYIIRDKDDTGDFNNRLDLPAFPYEAAFAIQDKMFKDDGELFYPAFPGDPFYADFITGEGAVLPEDPFLGGGPTGLAEFFGDHMVVNGKIWPKMDVEPRNYRLRLLNGCDSRFLVIQFFAVPNGTTNGNDVQEIPDDALGPLPFTVIGSDQGLASAPSTVDTLVFETGSRYDIIFDFNSVPSNSRVIMKNIGGDTPFGFSYGDNLDLEEDVFEDRQTDRIMAFDVNQPFNAAIPDVTPTSGALSAYASVRKKKFDGYQLENVNRTRKVALFEGTDEFGRLQPLLGTAEPATDYNGTPINWPIMPVFQAAGLTGQMEGAIAWHSPTTENPALGDTELWEVYNVTGDSHPVHLHLVHFEVIERRQIIWDSRTTEDDRVLDVDPNNNDPLMDGTYLVEQPVIQHNSTTNPETWGSGFKVINPTYGALVDPGSEYVDGNSPKDMVTARPDEVTFIKAKFDKPGRYVWHCHILSHEDHEMMRVMHVGPGA
jgi:FtsP/CotA-like multicopper oxidase with cupredoxin domain